MAATHLTKETFNEEVLQAKEPVLVDFWAHRRIGRRGQRREDLQGECGRAAGTGQRVQGNVDTDSYGIQRRQAGEKRSRGKVQSRDIRDVKIKNSDIRLADCLKWT